MINQTLKILCAIENKVFSPESGRQLTFYHKALNGIIKTTPGIMCSFLPPGCRPNIRRTGNLDVGQLPCRS